MDALAEDAVEKIAAFNAQNLANIAWAYATLELFPGALLGAVASAAIARRRELDPQSLANTVWAYAALDWRHEPLVAVIAEDARARAWTDVRVGA